MKLVLETREKTVAVSVDAKSMAAMIESYIDLLLAYGYEPDEILDGLQIYTEKTFKDLKK